MGWAKRTRNGRGKAKQAKLYPSQRMAITFDSNIKEQLTAFVGRLNDDVFRPAAYAAVTVLYDELKLRTEGGQYSEGDLNAAMYRWREKGDIGNKAIFYAGVNKRKAPHWWVVEHGHWQYFTVVKPETGPYAGQFVTLKNKPLPQPKFVPAKPYLGPAADKLPEAMQVAMRVMKERLKYVIRGVETPAMGGEYEFY